MIDTLHVATYNIHKGFSNFNRRMVVHELRERLRQLGADLVFLQEVQGDHQRHAQRFPNWPEEPQYEFLADSVWQDFAYGRNAVYDLGHHGNAVLSRYPIIRWDNEDVSAHSLESRGLLHCEVALPSWRSPLHCVCVHLGLTASGRRRQLMALKRRIDAMVPPDAPLIVAGDFNDWRLHARALLARPLHLTEVFELMRGLPARSFPALLPVFRLDRIYVRGFRVSRAHVHHGPVWGRISDHAALTTTLERI
jgi:endonuclease/exonuclease/phosphatase family metal-dependent hydrolase